MTKDEWIKVRGEPEVPLGVWFSYYKENGGDIDDPIQFEEKFNEIVSKDTVYIEDDILKRINYDTAHTRLFNYYDTMFGYESQ